MYLFFLSPTSFHKLGFDTFMTKLQVKQGPWSNPKKLIIVKPSLLINTSLPERRRNTPQIIVETEMVIYGHGCGVGVDTVSLYTV